MFNTTFNNISVISWRSVLWNNVITRRQSGSQNGLSFDHSVIKISRDGFVHAVNPLAVSGNDHEYELLNTKRDETNMSSLCKQDGASGYAYVKIKSQRCDVCKTVKSDDYLTVKYPLLWGEHSFLLWTSTLRGLLSVVFKFSLLSIIPLTLFSICELSIGTHVCPSPPIIAHPGQTCNCSNQRINWINVKSRRDRLSYNGGDIRTLNHYIYIVRLARQHSNKMFTKSVFSKFSQFLLKY
jgi:hypothetical protein